MLDPQSEVATTYRHKLAGKHGNHLVRVGRAEDRPNVGEYIVVEEAQPHVVQQCGLVQIPESDHIVRGFQVRLVHGHEDGVGSRRAVLLLNHPCCQGMRAWREAGGGGGEGRGGGGGGGARGEGRGARGETDHAGCSIFAEGILQLDGDGSATTFGDFCREPGLRFVVVPHP